jgi:hypothetical protein
MNQSALYRTEANYTQHKWRTTLYIILTHFLYGKYAEYEPCAGEVATHGAVREREAQ